MDLKRKWQLLSLAVLVIAAMAVPARAAITRFVDVPDSNIFANDIKWMDDNGITQGCGTDLFCPKGNVTREQMSAFMRRLANSQAVDAGTLDGMDSSAFSLGGHSHSGGELSGSWAITVGPDGWETTAPDTNLFIFRGNGTKIFGAVSAPWSAHLLMNPDLITVVGNTPLRLTAVEQCYNAKLATMTRFEVGIYQQNDVRDMGDLRHEFTFETDRTGSACDVLELSAPVVMTAEHGLSLTAVVNWANDGNEFDFGRTTFFLEPQPGADPLIP
ncbi:MAG: S-layer homology domain-containing protein [Acidimicrobiia bacterium]|nr:S-layer homology domain-containing protein [Acidimicrobiia bacterium]